MSEREEFEKWARKQNLAVMTVGEKYYSALTQMAWEGWQARTPQISEAEAVQIIADNIRLCGDFCNAEEVSLMAIEALSPYLNMKP